MSAEVARVLREAADLIEPPGRWTRGWLARDRYGWGVLPLSIHAVCWCVRGAIHRVAPSHDLMLGAVMAAGDQAGTCTLSKWNDAPGRTADEIVAALRAAADEAERS